MLSAVSKVNNVLKFWNSNSGDNSTNRNGILISFGMRLTAAWDGKHPKQNICGMANTQNRIYERFGDIVKKENQ